MTDPLLDEMEIQVELAARQLEVAGQTLALVLRTIRRANTSAEPVTETDADGDEPMETYDGA